MYVPAVNWMLMIAVMAILVISFQDSSKLASAYGIAVTGVRDYDLFDHGGGPQLLEGQTGVRLARYSRSSSSSTARSSRRTSLSSPTADGSRSLWLSSCSVCSRRGGVGASSCSTRCRNGPPLAEFVPELGRTRDIVRVSGSRVYLANNLDVTPFALVQQTRLLKTAADQIVLLRFVTATTPRVDPDKRLIVRRPYKDVT